MRYILFLVLTVGLVFALQTEDVSPRIGTTQTDADFTQLDYFSVEDLGSSVYCVGLGYDGTNLWVTDAADAGGVGDNMILIITLTSPHTLVTSVMQNGTSGWGLPDMCSNGTYMFGSQSNTVDYYDITTYEKVGSYTCGAVNPNRVQAFDGTYFYTGSFEETIYQVEWDGISGSTANYSAWSTAVANGGCYGGAYDSVGDCIYISTASYDGALYQIDMDGDLIAAYSLLPEDEISGGCTMAPFDGTNQLWVLAQSTPDGVFCWEVNDSGALYSETWGTIKTLF